MKKLIWLAAFVLFPSIAFAQPSIVFDTEMHDFGIVEKAGVLDYDFDFRNEGTQDLEINKIVPS